MIREGKKVGPLIQCKNVRSKVHMKANVNTYEQKLDTYLIFYKIIYKNK